jgi:uroporphyrinogen decarboxylase
MTERENWLRAVEYRRPEWIPSTVSLAQLVWHVHREKLEKLVLRHPRLFKGYRRGDVDFDEFPVVYREGEYFRDNWGCLWYNTIGGLEGQVVEHPLADWRALEHYRPPDPRTHAQREPRDWGSIRAEIGERRRQGLLTWGNGERLFDRLYFLRGFEALMIDIATDDPHLPLLLEMLLEYETKLVRMWLDQGVDVVGFHMDIGAQNALMISPEKFRKYIKPLYRELFTMCRSAGAHVYLSSDGNLLSIVDDLIECGVSVHDPQYRANTLPGIERVYRGRLCVNVDLDRQMLAFCQPSEIREQVREVVARIGDPAGGLMVAGSVWDGLTPLENIEALCGALEDYCLM